MEGGIIGLIILALDIYAIICILKEAWSGVKKLVWILIVLLFPIIGMAVYFLFFRGKDGTV